MRTRIALLAILTTTVALTPAAHAGCELTYCERLEALWDTNPITVGSVDADTGGGYDASGNQQCSTAEQLAEQAGVAGSDLDNDGVGNCTDPDDDGDLLSDQFEDSRTGYSQTVKDVDTDGVIDSYDVTPAVNGAVVSIVPREYRDLVQCDIEVLGVGPADPYLKTFSVSIGSGQMTAGEIPLAIPVGWQASNHKEDRAQDDVTDLTLNAQNGTQVAAGQISLPNDIALYPRAGTSDSTFPTVTLNVDIWDHDLAFDNRMHLGNDENGVAHVTQSLGTDQVLRYGTQGSSGDCYGRIGFDISDTVSQAQLRTALYHYLHPSELIGVGTPL